MANSVDPDQTAPWEQFDLGIHCLLTGMSVQIFQVNTVYLMVLLISP